MNEQEPEFTCDICRRIVAHYHRQRYLPDGRAACCLCFWALGHTDADPHEEDAA